MQINPVHKSAIFKKFLKYTKTSDITFRANMLQYSHYATCLQEGSTHFGLWHRYKPAEFTKFF